MYDCAFQAVCFLQVFQPNTYTELSICRTHLIFDLVRSTDHEAPRYMHVVSSSVLLLPSP
jgi:hypothetical protein